ncbi:hypothetical protein V5O48_018099, partial [Marasmius crinis-equi]
TPGIQKPAFLDPYSCLLEYVLSRGLISLDESEIQGNLSHGDIFGKLSALLSTGWFLLQIAARGIQELAISEIEVVTLSFTSLSIAAYVLWWDKPQRVRYPVRITWEPIPPNEAKSISPRRYLHGISRVWREFRGRLAADFDSVIGTTAQRTQTCSKMMLIFIPGWYPIYFFTHQIRYLLQFSDHDIRRGSNPINMFRTGIPHNTTADVNSPMSIVFVGLIVAAVHFVAWNSQFPTTFLQTVWRINTVVLLAVVVPGTSTFVPIVLLVAPRHWREILAYVWVIGYVTARVTLIGLAILIPLKYGFQESGYRDVDWLQFIVHIG